MPRDPRLWDLTPGASQLNDDRDDVIDLFRGGMALAKIGAKFGMVAAGVQKWLRAQGEYDRQVTCALEECDVIYPFRPGKLYCTNLHARRANARAVRHKFPEKEQARSALSRALYSGQIDRPKKCERCGRRPGQGKDGRSLIKADHHHGYDKAHHLDVWWICSGCDHEIEKLRREGNVVDREHPLLDIH